MPVVKRTNARVIPANNRAVDVAKTALEGVVDIQQRRYLNAFRVQGYPGLLYSRLQSGLRCSCQSSGKQIKTLLDEDGNADVGTINQLLTGAQFGVSDYGSSKELNEQTSKDGMRKHDGTFDIKASGEYPNEFDDFSNGDNGPNPEFDLDDIVNGFDTSMMGLTEASCCVCFGTGYVSGYQAFNTNRQVLTPDLVTSDGHIDYQSKPFVGVCKSFQSKITIPRGTLDIDAFLLWNNNERVNFTFTLDGVVGTRQLVMRMADGKPHDLQVFVKGERWTHFELQFNISREQAWFEFPRLSKGNDLSFLETTEPFQIILSPNIPILQAEDIITDSTFGLHYIVQGTPLWNTRNRHTLGWECQVRVIQPQELYALLPKRRRTPEKNRTVNPVHDNKRGQRV